MARRGGPEPVLSFLSGVAVGVPVVHFTWMAEEARRHPQWLNRAWG